jgi:hypothetical protein
MTPWDSTNRLKAALDATEAPKPPVERRKGCTTHTPMFLSRSTWWCMTCGAIKVGDKWLQPRRST